MALLINGVEVEPNSFAPSNEQLAREWKNAELARTDRALTLPDFDYTEQMLAYRRQLKDWTDTEDFPDVRPVMPLTPKGYPIY